MSKVHIATWITSLASALLLTLPSRADSPSQEAVAFYNKGDYKAASKILEQMIQHGRADANSYYYAALSYHHMKDYARAKALYQEVLSKFPGSQASQMASDALAQLRGGGRSTLSRSVSGGSSSPSTYSSSTANADYLPQESSVYFEKGPGGHLIIDAQVNNRQMKVYFDTGAEGTHFGKNHLLAAGLKPPDGKATSWGYGVGGRVDEWETEAEIKVGDIKRRLKVSVEEESGLYPLLGQDFFRDFQYEIDNGAHRIRFHRKSGSGSVSRSAGSDPYAVPFTLMGREMMVQLEHRGRRCPVIFDTGAFSILLTPQDAQTLGIEIPDDAQEAYSTGVGGQIRGVRFNVDELRLGGVLKRDVPVFVAQTGHSLLGQTFFGDMRYTIDNQNKVIRFFH